MVKRDVSKKTRFEVFKRDSFTCQYCGRSAPDVVLECDHIIPLADGGDNEIENLITSCFDCNRGKGKRRLDEKEVLSIREGQLEKAQAIKEQTEMLIQWKQDLHSIDEMQIDAIEELCCLEDDKILSVSGRNKILRLIRKFGFQEVYESTSISFCRYFNGSEKSWNHAFDKIGGVCYNRKYRSGGDSNAE